MSEKKISLNELKEPWQQNISLALKTTFVKLTNSDTWERAGETFPTHATQMKLSRVLLKKGIPKPLQDFCHEVYLSRAGIVPESITSFDCNDGPLITVNLIEGKLPGITGQVIQRSQPSFSGVDLAVVLIDEVCGQLCN